MSLPRTSRQRLCAYPPCGRWFATPHDGTWPVGYCSAGCHRAAKTAKVKRRDERVNVATRAALPSAGQCVCGCGRKRGLQRHHVIYAQELRRIVAAEHKASGRAGPPDIIREMALLSDRRNLVLIGPKCHAAHHARERVLSLHALPDSVFEFAAEVLHGRAHGYLSRRYAGDDLRLDALLEIAAR